MERRKQSDFIFFFIFKKTFFIKKLEVLLKKVKFIKTNLTLNLRRLKND